MQGFLSSTKPRPPQTSDSAPEISSPTTSSTRGINYPSMSVVFPSSGYHYKKKNVDDLTTTVSMGSTESGRSLTPKDTMDGIATIGKAHKLNFSLSSFIGGAPMNAKHRDPSPRSPTSGAPAQSVSDPKQGPSQEHPETGIQKSLEAIEAANKLGRLRKSSSSMSLKLKIPRLKSPKQQKNKPSDGQSSVSQTTGSPLSRNSALGLGRMGVQRNGSVDSTSPDFKDEISSTINLPSRSATAMALRNEEESRSGTPRTITDTNSVLKLRLNEEDNSVLTHDNVSSVIQSLEFRKSRTRRARPTKTQDDISLNARSTIDKYKSWRLSRRASLSATTNLMSFTEFRSLSSTHTSSSSLTLDQGSNKNSYDIKFPTRADPSNSESKSKGSAPSSSPILEYSTEDLLTPTALLYTDMAAFPPSDDAPLPHSQPPVRESVSTSPSRTPSSDSGVSTPEMTSGSSLYTSSSISSHPEKNKPTIAQLEQWREDVEIILADLDDEFEGEACLIRFEPKQGWFGFWNKESVVEVIEDLRELRSPRP